MAGGKLDSRGGDIVDSQTGKSESMQDLRRRLQTDISGTRIHPEMQSTWKCNVRARARFEISLLRPFLNDFD